MLMSLMFAASLGASAAAGQDLYVTKPDYVVYVPGRARSAGRGPATERGETYNDHFQVLWDDGRKLYHAFWTQGSWEGAGDHHIMYSKSADKGRTWSEPTVLAGSERRACKRFEASWQQPMLSKSGRLYCLWNQKVRKDKLPREYLAGFYSDDGGDTWGEPGAAARPRTQARQTWKIPIYKAWINWQRPLRLAVDGKFFVGCSEQGGRTRFWRFENIDDDPEVEDIKISDFPAGEARPLGLDAMAEVSQFAPSDKAKVLEEASVVKLPDGRLFALMRSSTGHPVWSQSRDGGETWSAPKFLRDREDGRPFLHPRSPCPIYDWKGPEAGSGTYFAFIHNTFDFNGKTAYQKRGPLFLIAGRFDPSSEQPIVFGPPKPFAGRGDVWNSFCTSYTVVDGEGVLWYPDAKFYLLGRRIGKEWFQ